MNIHKKLQITLILLSLNCIDLIANHPFATQLITMFFNSNPENELTMNKKEIINIGPISSELLVALVQESSIIVVNDSLIEGILRYLQQESMSSGTMRRAKEFFQNFVPSNWIKKRIAKDSRFYVLIPKKYVNERENYKKIENVLKKISKKSSYSAEELTIGIKLQSNSISDEDFIDAKYHSGSAMQGLAKILVTNLDDIFIKKSEYYTIFSELSTEKDEYIISQLIPQSIVYITGHGSRDPESPNEAFIASLYSKWLGHIIAFFQKNLAIKLLFLDTCYASEYNIKLALQNTAEVIDQKLERLELSFPIISGAVSADVVTKEVTTYSIKNPYPNFSLFFKKITEKDHPQENDIIHALNNIIYNINLSANNIPIIKNKDLPWRSMDVDFLNIVRIDNVLAKSRDPNKPLKTSEFSGKKLVESEDGTTYQVIAINAPLVPFEIILPTDFKKHYLYMPQFISMVPKNSLQILSSIDAHKFNLTKILDSIMPMKKLKEYKIFNIKKLIVFSDQETIFQDNNFGKKITVTNVWSINGPDGRMTSFEYNDKFWLYKGNKIQEINADEFKKIIDNAVNKVEN